MYGKSCSPTPGTPARSEQNSKRQKREKERERERERERAQPEDRDEKQSAVRTENGAGQYRLLVLSMRTRVCRFSF